MSQEASTDQIVSESSQYIAPQSGTMDNCADGLMNDIFADLDQFLDGSGNLPSQPAKPEYQAQVTASQPTMMSNMVMSPVQPTPPARYSQLSTVVNRTPLTKKRRRRPSRPWFSPILSLGTIASVATVAVIFWLFNQGAFNRLIMAKSVPTAAQNKVEVQADLVNYIQQSLAAIDQQKPTNNQTAAKVSIGLPPIPTTTQPQATTTQPLIERLYIPMYQPPQPLNYAPPALPPLTLPSQQLSQYPVREVPKTPPAMPKALSAMRSATKPVVVPQVVAYHPQVLPQLPIALPAAPPPPAQKIALAIPTSAMTPKYMLKGVLELGAKSAALFDIEGVPHPVQIGEGIGESGWTLVEVGNGEAVIRRNGEVRSVYPLQRF